MGTIRIGTKIFRILLWFSLRARGSVRGEATNLGKRTMGTALVSLSFASEDARSQHRIR